MQSEPTTEQAAFRGLMCEIVAKMADVMKRAIGDALARGVVTDRAGARQLRGATPAGLIRGVCAVECERLTAAYRATATDETAADVAKKVELFALLIDAIEVRAVAAVASPATIPADPGAAALASIDDFVAEFNDRLRSAHVAGIPQPRRVVSSDDSPPVLAD